MKPSADGSLLHLPLTVIGMSDTFTKAAIVNGYNTLSDILDIPLTQLATMEWFTPSMFDELARTVKAVHYQSGVRMDENSKG